MLPWRKITGVRVTGPAAPKPITGTPSEWSAITGKPAGERRADWNLNDLSGCWAGGAFPSRAGQRQVQSKYVSSWAYAGAQQHRNRSSESPDAMI